jgi:hypothetical protein
MVVYLVAALLVVEVAALVALLMAVAWLIGQGR